MHVFLVQVDVIVGPLQGAEFQCLVLGNLGSFLGLCRVCCSVWLSSVICHLSTDFGRPDFWLPAVFSLLTLSWPWSTVKDRRRDHATTEEHRGLLCLRAEPLGRAPSERLWGLSHVGPRHAERTHTPSARSTLHSPCRHLCYAPWRLSPDDCRPSPGDVQPSSPAAVLVRGLFSVRRI